MFVFNDKEIITTEELEAELSAMEATEGEKEAIRTAFAS